MTKKTLYRAVKCPCGHPVCKSWMVSPPAFVAGVNFTEEEAKTVADVLNDSYRTELVDFSTMNDEEFKKFCDEIESPYGLIQALHHGIQFFGYDPYYGDLHTSMTNMISRFAVKHRPAETQE